MKRLLVVILSICSIICTFKLIYKNLLQPFTEAEIEECIVIAYNICYSEQMDFCYDIPNGYYVEINSGTVTVKPNCKKYGYVKCTLNGNKIESKFYNEKLGYAVIVAFITFVIYSLLFFLVFYNKRCKNEHSEDEKEEKSAN